MVSGKAVNTNSCKYFILRKKVEFVKNINNQNKTNNRVLLKGAFCERFYSYKLLFHITKIVCEETKKITLNLNNF